MELQGRKDMLDDVTNDESGQGLVEYALMILFVSIVSILALTVLGTTISGLIDSVGAAFP
ncbi:MAG: Flp family type IVb pilin [Chloroflexota bacterium]|nr:Flp family type IVb pilin [Chloroflexota bacterium]